MKASVGSKIIRRLEGFAEALESKAAVSEQFTCRKIVLNLKPTPYDPKLVKETRRILGASQAVFAQFLGVSPKTVHAWEQGLSTPQDIACRFMDEIRGNPPYWVDRLRRAAVTK